MKMAWLLLSVLSLSGCGANNNETKLNDVGTDITERGSSGQSQMYWREADLIKRGNCDRSDLILRRYCQTNVIRKYSYGESAVIFNRRKCL